MLRRLPVCSLYNPNPVCNREWTVIGYFSRYKLSQTYLCRFILLKVARSEPAITQINNSIMDHVSNCFVKTVTRGQTWQVYQKWSEIWVWKREHQVQWKPHSTDTRLIERTGSYPAITGFSRPFAMVAKFLDLKKPWSCKYGRRKKRKKLACKTILYMIVRRIKTVTHTLLPFFNNTNGPLCQERSVEIQKC